MPDKGHYALVFGASGISGWAIMRECLAYPSPTTFARVIGLTSRHLSREDALFPEESKRWELYSGMDLEKRVDTVAQKLKGIHEIEKVTHVYFAAYTGHGNDYDTLKKANVNILSNAVLAVEQLCPNLQFWTLQTGGKAYGVEFLDKGINYKPPLKESSPRIPEPWASNVFYYAQYDKMLELSKGRRWKFCEIRPDAIIGFVPQNNAMNLAQALGLFLSMYTSLEGKGAEVAFPGSETAYKALHTDTSQDILARFHIFASLHPKAVSQRAFNIADGDVVAWEQVWPSLCSYFGLRGTGPNPSKSSGAKWMQEHEGQWAQWVKDNRLKEGRLEGTSWEFLTAIMEAIDFNRQYDMSACREVGFKDAVPTIMGYALAFDRMRNARIIP